MDEAKYLAVAALVYTIPDTDIVLDAFCSATLVAPKTVVTARHCTPAITDAPANGLGVAVAFGPDALASTLVVPITDSQLACFSCLTAFEGRKILVVSRETMDFRRMGRLVVTVHTAAVPKDSEWADYMAQVDAYLPLSASGFWWFSQEAGRTAHSVR